MATALAILQGFNNATLQAMDSATLQAAIDLAFLEIHKETYGTMANAAAANLAAHNLLTEAAAGSSGQTKFLKRKRIGSREEEYFSGSGSDSRGNDFSSTPYGIRFQRMRDQVSVGFINSAS